MPQRERFLEHRITGPVGVGEAQARRVGKAQGVCRAAFGLRAQGVHLAQRAGRGHRHGVAVAGDVDAQIARVLTALRELRQTLPAAVTVWAGGSCPALDRQGVVAGVLRLHALERLPEQVALWRAAAAPA